MKILTRTPLLLLAIIALLSVVLFVSAQTPTPTPPAKEYSTVFKHRKHVPNIKKFDKSLPADEMDYLVTYEGVPNHPHKKGKLPDPCPDAGDKTNIHVTQQINFATKEELKTFLDKAFAP